MRWCVPWSSRERRRTSVCTARWGPSARRSLPTWRVDSVVLVVLAFVLLPVSLGRWELGRWEGAGLILGYAMYLILEAAVTIRL